MDSSYIDDNNDCGGDDDNENDDGDDNATILIKLKRQLEGIQIQSHKRHKQ